ncbi:MAG: hypothetical protein QOF56_604 [Acidobacteriaceae bacterium]|nr:hypothetical protein [Acidobacteriaceae bacterium]
MRHIINRWKVNISGIADPRFGQELGYVVNAYCKQIAGT